MSSNLVALVPLNEQEFVVWFEGGVSKQYRTNDIAEVLDANDLVLSSDGTAITWGHDGALSAEELAPLGVEVDFVNDEKYRLLKSLSAIRRTAAFSQTRLGEAAGIRQSVISRIEGCEISPQINTLLKLLAPLGKTLAIVDLAEK